MNITSSPNGELKELFRPLALLVFASMTCGVLLGMRILISGHLRQLYLVWNLFLAWLPLLFALVVAGSERRTRRPGWFALAATLGWLLFFPNAPYILTDLTHLRASSQGRFWVDLVMVLLFGLTGLVLGFVSLYLMQGIVARRLGWPMGWLFAAGVGALAGFGVYLGRFLRWNTWDIVFNPVNLAADVGNWLLGIPGNPRSLVLPALFGTLVLVAYVLLYSITHLQTARHYGQIAEQKHLYDAA